MEKNKYSKAKIAMIVINITAIVLILGIIIFLCFYFSDFFKLFSDKNGKEEIMKKIKNTGFVGFLILLLVDIFQILVAFIPGEIVEIVAGAMFGPWVGTLLCLLGLTIANYLIYYLVKLLGKPFASLNVKEKEFTRFKFLNEPGRALIILFFFFLIPGIPKDFVVFLIPFTTISIHKFVLVSIIARIPSIIPSTFAGNAILGDNLWVAGVIMGVMVVISIIGIVFNKKIYQWILSINDKRKEKKSGDLNE